MTNEPNTAPSFPEKPEFSAHVAVIAEQTGQKPDACRFTAWGEGPSGYARRIARRITAEQIAQARPGFMMEGLAGCTLRRTAEGWHIAGGAIPRELRNDNPAAVMCGWQGMQAEALCTYWGV